MHTLGANNSWPRGTRPAERLPYSPPFVRGQGRFPSLGFVRIPLLRSANLLFASRCAVSNIFPDTSMIVQTTRRNIQRACKKRVEKFEKELAGKVKSTRDLEVRLLRSGYKRKEKKKKYPEIHTRERLTHSSKSLGEPRFHLYLESRDSSPSRVRTRHTYAHAYTRSARKKKAGYCYGTTTVGFLGCGRADASRRCKRIEPEPGRERRGGG